MGFIEALIAGCVGGFIVYMITRRAGDAGSAATTAEIDRLRTVVEELSAALEGRAEAVEKRLGKAITEAQAVQSVLDRALASVGAQIVRPEPAIRDAVETAKPVPAAVQSQPVVDEPAQSPLPESVPEPVAEIPVPPTPDAPRPAITPISDVLRPDVAAAVEKGFVAEPIAAVDAAAAPAEAKTAPVESAVTPATAVTPKHEVVLEETPPPPVSGGVARNEPGWVPSAEPTPRTESKAGGRDPRETAEREAHVMSLVARGVTDSVDLSRQTGLTRGEVELILTLHNLHIAPTTILQPLPPTPAPAASPQEAAARPRPQPAAEVPTSNGASAPESPPLTPDDRYAAIYALIAAGITDSVEIARRTGLGRGEVELHMGLHARNVL